MSSRRISPTAARPASVIIQRANWRSALSAATTLEGARNVPAAAGSGTSPQPPAARPPRSGPTRRRRACPPAPARGQGRRSPGWHGTHAGEVVDVGCFSSGGGRENRSFGVSYVRSGNLLGAGGLTSAYAYGNRPTATVYQPRTQYDSTAAPAWSSSARAAVSTWSSRPGPAAATRRADPPTPRRRLRRNRRPGQRSTPRLRPALRSAGQLPGDKPRPPSESFGDGASNSGPL